MAETRSKTLKKRDGSGSFISNLSSAIKKSSKRQLEDKHVSLPTKKWKCPKVSKKTTNDNCQDEEFQINSLRNTSESSNSLEIVNQGFEDFSEEPLCFDGSDNEAETCSDQKSMKNDTPAKQSNNACGTNLLAEVVNNSESAYQELRSSTILECHGCNNEPNVSLPQTNEVNSSVTGNEVMIPSPNDLSGPSDRIDLNIDSNTTNSNVKGPGSKVFIGPYNDLVNVLEDIKYINVVVKNIKEEMEKLIK
ncbi:hypothetical protein J437_LFUL000964 [Ladona fulva]|uniref:Uncharacterized protein n=1 Tax=Ladona fulva TaxID=123851 RepID=A0A8K0KH04_LADFU|nr:hypothetical protein J437_LFUL000964 [Ladona fulva]